MIPFDQPLTPYSDWSIKGNYLSVTKPDGETYLDFISNLSGPTDSLQLKHNQAHYSIMILGSDSAFSEYLQCG